MNRGVAPRSQGAREQKCEVRNDTEGETWGPDWSGGKDVRVINQGRLASPAAWEEREAVTGRPEGADQEGGETEKALPGEP